MVTSWNCQLRRAVLQLRLLRPGRPMLRAGSPDIGHDPHEGRDDGKEDQADNDGEDRHHGGLDGGEDAGDAAVGLFFIMAGDEGQGIVDAAGLGEYVDHAGVEAVEEPGCGDGFGETVSREKPVPAVQHFFIHFNGCITFFFLLIFFVGIFLFFEFDFSNCLI